MSSRRTGVLRHRAPCRYICSSTPQHKPRPCLVPHLAARSNLNPHDLVDICRRHHNSNRCLSKHSGMEWGRSHVTSCGIPTHHAYTAVFSSFCSLAAWDSSLPRPVFSFLFLLKSLRLSQGLVGLQSLLSAPQPPLVLQSVPYPCLNVLRARPRWFPSLVQSLFVGKGLVAFAFAFAALAFAPLAPIVQPLHFVVRQSLSFAVLYIAVRLSSLVALDDSRVLLWL